jgi:hypothetical protein
VSSDLQFQTPCSIFCAVGYRGFSFNRSVSSMPKSLFCPLIASSPYLSKMVLLAYQACMCVKVKVSKIVYLNALYSLNIVLS